MSDQDIGRAVLGAAVLGLLGLWVFNIWVGIAAAIVGAILAPKLLK